MPKRAHTCRPRSLADQTRDALATQADGAHAPYIFEQLRETFRLLGDLDAELDAQLHVVAEAGRLQPGEPRPDQLNTLADIYFRLRRYDEAGRWYAAALDALVATKPDDHEPIAIVRHNLANILAETGHTDAALVMHEEALDGFRHAYAVADLRLAQRLIEVAEHYADDAQPEPARSLLAEARPHLGTDAGLQQRAAALAAQLGEEPEPGATYYGPLIQEAIAALNDNDNERGISAAADPANRRWTPAP